jgi:hypothetical protein
MFQYQYHLQYYKSYEPLLPLQHHHHHHHHHHHQMITYPIQYPMCYGGRKTGRVKFFNASKGYGFIIPTNTSKERGKRSTQAAAVCNDKSVVDSSSNHDQEDDDVAEGISMIIYIYSYRVSNRLFYTVFVHQTSIIGSSNKGCVASLYKVLFI